MGCVLSDVSWDDLDDFDFSSDLSSEQSSAVHGAKHMPRTQDSDLCDTDSKEKMSMKKVRQSLSFRFALNKTTRKSLEIIEKRSSQLGLGCRNSRDSTSQEQKKRISLTEVESWSDPNNGFQALLKSQAGVKLFMQFLKKEYSDENLLFWLACVKLKEEQDPGDQESHEFEEYAEKIFQEFLTPHSPSEVSLDSRVRERVTSQRSQPNRQMFDEAQGKIFALMHRDSYPRFLSSPVYKNLLNI